MLQEYLWPAGPRLEVYGYTAIRVRAFDDIAAREMASQYLRRWLSAQPRMATNLKRALLGAFASDLMAEPRVRPTKGSPGVEFEGC